MLTAVPCNFLLWYVFAPADFTLIISCDEPHAAPSCAEQQHEGPQQLQQQCAEAHAGNLQDQGAGMVGSTRVPSDIPPVHAPDNSITPTSEAAAAAAQDVPLAAAAAVAATAGMPPLAAAVQAGLYGGDGPCSGQHHPDPAELSRHSTPTAMQDTTGPAAPAVTEPTAALRPQAAAAMPAPTLGVAAADAALRPGATNGSIGSGGNATSTSHQRTRRGSSSSNSSAGGGVPGQAAIVMPVHGEQQW